MTLEHKLQTLRQWNKHEAQKCFTTYMEKYTLKHGGALHHAMMQGSLDKYIEHECRTFARYAKMWNYVRMKDRKAFVQQYAESGDDLPIPKLFAGKTPTPLKTGYE